MTQQIPPKGLRKLVSNPLTYRDVLNASKTGGSVKIARLAGLEMGDMKYLSSRYEASQFVTISEASRLFSAVKAQATSLVCRNAHVGPSGASYLHIPQVISIGAMRDRIGLVRCVSARFSPRPETNIDEELLDAAVTFVLHLPVTSTSVPRVINGVTMHLDVDYKSVSSRPIEVYAEAHRRTPVSETINIKQNDCFA